MESLQILCNPSKRKKALLIVSSSLITAGWAAYFFGDSALLFNTLMILSALVAGFEIARRAWQGFINRHTNIELLVTIAATGGLAIGIYWEAAAVTFLFLLGGWLEARTLSKTRSTLKELINLAPDTAILLKDGNQHELPARDVEEGDLILVKPGGKIPVDGIVESGHTTVDESAVTGEPVPAEKQKGTDVYAGTINRNGRIRVRASRSGSDTTLAKVIRRVEEAQEEKAPTQRFIERFSSWYTPGIVGLSIASYLFTWDLELALTLLVIGCPGALVISTPISIITGIGRAAQKGILIKGGEYLENAGKISAVALDKTGTLTEGRPRVTDLLKFQPITVTAGGNKDSFGTPKIVHQAIHQDSTEPLSDDLQEMLYWATIAESASEHPLADAIIEAFGKEETIPEAEYFESHTGQGIEATYQSNRVLVGSPDFIGKNEITLNNRAKTKINELAETGRSVVLVALNGQLIGGLGIMDTIRPEAKQMISKLRANDIERIVMLTGDAPETANYIAREAGIDEVHARMMPEQKLDIIKNLQQEGHRVAMTGDGINDAPALATADIGIAMGAAGTDVAIETADIALMADELMKIPEALRLSSKTLSNIRQNVVIALVTVAALLTGVFTCSVHMAGGMLIHELSVMAVILNGMRLKWL